MVLAQVAAKPLQKRHLQLAHPVRRLQSQSMKLMLELPPDCTDSTVNSGGGGSTKVSIVPASSAVAGTAVEAAVGAAARSGKCGCGLGHIRLVQCSTQPPVPLWHSSIDPLPLVSAVRHTDASEWRR